MTTEDDTTPARRTRTWRTLIAVAAVLILVAGGMIAGVVGTLLLAAPRGSCDAAAVADRVLPTIVTVQVRGDGGSGNGSGQIIDGDGHVLTNNHVIAPGSTPVALVVRLSDGEELPATLVGRDPKTDLAVLKVTSEESLPVIRTGDSGSLSVGQPVVALGAPLGLSSTVTAGIVSALGRTVPVPSNDATNAVLAGAIQTDASINPGNSGGALVDCDGRLVGVNTAIATVPSGGGQSSSGSVGIGFAVPVAQALPIARELIEHGRVDHPSAGVSVTPIPPSVAAAFGITDGLFVQSVASGGPADEAGIRAGDILTSVNGRPATSVDALTAVQVTSSAGDTVDVEYLRGGAKHTATVTLR
ncbi:trypsin-like peptidase domain-containing protein [Leifsonia sp. F6_8S_P_1B]|uniref:Trypsin-like peptidase domain-containing protein n=1 Tax=Leifsonia williamsii TaxID=3035919 RepID=A0ABT8K5X2_9MICO|nr:trypsin-like peptidase domain-containing protein [Leifsonia williamsii]MDN4612849.1 trypsin-like peptidase domain-containing protein [Leifsonia williamsii]